MVLSPGESRGNMAEDGRSGNTCPFIEPRDPSITQPWVHPRPAHGTNLCRLLDEQPEQQKDAVSQHLQVFLRIKPTPAGESALYRQLSSTALLTLAALPPRDRKSRPVNKLYRFTHIFGPDNCQTQIFDEIVKENLGRFVEGENFSLLTYGASGSGKTYSLMGTDTEPGVVPRCLEFLFARVQVAARPSCKPANGAGLERLSPQQQDKEIKAIEHIVRAERTATAPDLPSYRRMSQQLTPESRAWRPAGPPQAHYEVWVSFSEIYNESARDLLADAAVSSQPPSSLRLVQPAAGQPYLKDIRWLCVRSGAEAFAVLARGRRRLRTAHTNQNSQSSRSHCLFTLRLLQCNSQDPSRQMTASTFRLIDLAGSERAKRTGNSGVRLNESSKINTSLLVLERCLQATRCRQGGLQAIPPYRESKLTKLLQNALSGKEQISMLVNINPEPDSFHETQHVLQFSALAGSIEVAVDPAEEDCAAELLELQAELTKSRRDVECRLQQRGREAEWRLQERLEQREREVRRDVASRFQQIMDESSASAHRHFQLEIELVAEKHTFEIEQLKNHHKEHLQECTSVAAALSASRLALKEELQDTLCRLHQSQLLLESKELALVASATALKALEDRYSALQLEHEELTMALQLAGLCTADVSSKPADTLATDSGNETSNDSVSVGTVGQGQDLSLELNNPVETGVDNPLQVHEEVVHSSMPPAAEDFPGQQELCSPERSEADKGACFSATSSSRRKRSNRRTRSERKAGLRTPARSTLSLDFNGPPGKVPPPALETPYYNRLRKRGHTPERAAQK